jgi:hypothetical protein
MNIAPIAVLFFFHSDCYQKCDCIDTKEKERENPYMSQLSLGLHIKKFNPNMEQLPIVNAYISQTPPLFFFSLSLSPTIVSFSYHMQRY